MLYTFKQFIKELLERFFFSQRDHSGNSEAVSRSWPRDAAQLGGMVSGSVAQHMAWLQATGAQPAEKGAIKWESSPRSLQKNKHKRANPHRQA